MGFSILMLALFFLYGLGLAGMFTRRTHNNYSQTCHRGISANFFLSAVGLFFIFSIVIAIACMTLSIPGTVLRRLACKPVIELEQNEVFQVGQTSR